MKRTTTDNSIRIYVANLAAYNNGHLIGSWIDLPCNDLKEQLAAIVSRFPEGDELAIHDYEAPFKINEYDNIHELNELAETLEDLTEYDMEKVVYLVEEGESFQYALEHYEDVQFYSDMRLTDVAEELVDEGCFGTIPDSLRNYIDFAAIARDLSFDGYHETSQGVFRRD